MAALHTRLTQRLGLAYPIVSAPMAFAAGGALAAAVTRAGGLGLIGGGYGDQAWLDEQFAAAAGERVGVGFITWSLARNPALLAHVLGDRPAAVMLSFGDPRPFAHDISAAGALLICQCQALVHVAQAVEAGADIVIAQGAEAGGRGASQGTLTLVPEVADYLAKHSPSSRPASDRDHRRAHGARRGAAHQLGRKPTCGLAADDLGWTAGRSGQ